MRHCDEFAALAQQYYKKRQYEVREMLQCFRNRAVHASGLPARLALQPTSDALLELGRYGEPHFGYWSTVLGRRKFRRYEVGKAFQLQRGRGCLNIPPHVSAAYADYGFDAATGGAVVRALELSDKSPRRTRLSRRAFRCSSQSAAVFLRRALYYRRLRVTDSISISAIQISRHGGSAAGVDCGGTARSQFSRSLRVPAASPLANLGARDRP